MQLSERTSLSVPSRAAAAAAIVCLAASCIPEPSSGQNVGEDAACPGCGDATSGDDTGGTGGDDAGARDTGDAAAHDLGGGEDSGRRDQGRSDMGSGPFRIPLTIAEDAERQPLTNFPVYVLSPEASLRDYEPSDLAFVDADGIPLPFEIDRQSGMRVGAWVLLPSLGSGATTFYLHVRDRELTRSQESPFSDYFGVYHFERADSVTDSSPAGVDGQASGITSANGEFSRAFAFEEGSHVLLDQEGREPPALTISFWLYRERDPEGPGVVLRRPGVVQPVWEVEVARSGAMQVQMGTGLTLDGEYVLEEERWHYVAMTLAPPNFKVYLDGASVGSAELNTGVAYGAGATSIGAVDDPSFVGLIDEVRFAGVVREPSWIRTEYLNLSDPESFVTWGAREDL